MTEIKIPLLLWILLVLFVAGLIVASVIVFGTKQRAFKRQQELLRVQLEIEEQTRTKISQELHDNIGQVLSLIKLSLNTMNIREPGKLEQKIVDSKYLISKAIQDLRDLSKSLDTDFVKENGLFKSIEYELEIAKRAGSLETNLAIVGDVYRLDQQDELVLFRLFQEAINNIIKHAKATLISINILYGRNSFEMEIRDNGAGCDLSSIQNRDNVQKGLGIRNMERRARIIGAEFDMQSTIDQGTILRIKLSKAQIKTNLVLIDHHPILRRGIRQLIESFGSYRVLFEANNGQDFINQLNPHSLPEIVCLEVSMPEINGYELCVWLKNNYPQIKVLVFSIYNDEKTIIRMLRAGAKGYVVKDSEPEVLKAALNSIITTGFYFSERATQIPDWLNTQDKNDDHLTPPVVLNDGEVAFLQLIYTERTLKEISDIMSVTPQIVRSTIENLSEKLNVESRVGLVMYAIKNGIVT